VLIPKVLASSNLGLKLANAFGVFFKLNQYPILLTWGRCGLISSLLNELGSVELSVPRAIPIAATASMLLGRTSIVC
jgi:hypothetical protein